MKYEDLSFDIKKEDGTEIGCDILYVVPNNERPEEPYVVFTDYTLDETDEFVEYYGRIKENNGEYALEVITDEKIIEKIKEGLNDEVVTYVNEQIQTNMTE